MHRSLHIQRLLNDHPWVAVPVVLLLAGAFFLPSLHHLTEHHDGAADQQCPVCLLAGLGVQAILAAVLAPPVLLANGAVVLPGGRRTSGRPTRPALARAPPLSD